MKAEAGNTKGMDEAAPSLSGKDRPERRKTAVIITAHGEAETTGFTGNFSMTRHTLDHASAVMSIPAPFKLLIAVISGLKNSFRFRKTGYVSPHNEITRMQANGIGEKLGEHCKDEAFSFDVFTAFSVTPPFLEDVIRSTGNYDLRIMLSMSPVESRLTCGSICYLLQELCDGKELAGIKVISPLWKERALMELYLDHIFSCSFGAGSDYAEKPVLVLAFHGTLVADSDGAAPRFQTGARETQAFAESMRKAIIKDVRNFYGDVITAYLNHDVGGTWTTPSLEQVLEDLAAQNTGRVSLFAAGFFAEGNETLLRAGEALERSGIGETLFIPCINDADAFLGFLSDRIIAAAKQVVR